MIEDWFGLLVFVAISLLSLLNMRRKKRPPLGEADDLSAAPSTPGALTTAWPEKAAHQDAAPEAAALEQDVREQRTPEPAAGPVLLAELVKASTPQRQAQRATAADAPAGRMRPQARKPSPEAARQAIIAMAVYGPCRAEVPYPLAAEQGRHRP